MSEPSVHARAEVREWIIKTRGPGTYWRLTTIAKTMPNPWTFAAPEPLTLGETSLLLRFYPALRPRLDVTT